MVDTYGESEVRFKGEAGGEASQEGINLAGHFRLFTSPGLLVLAEAVSCLTQ